MTTIDRVALARADEAFQASAMRLLPLMADEWLMDELTKRGFTISKPVAPEPTAQQRGKTAQHQGFVGTPFEITNAHYILHPWEPARDHRPPTWSRTGYSKGDVDPWGDPIKGLGSARRGECTTCVKSGGPIRQAMFRMTGDSGRGTTVSSLCFEHAQTFVQSWGLTGPPRLTPKVEIEIPTFATAEEAQAWLDAYRP